MTTSTECEANILRYYHVEKWKVGTIARQLGIHHSVVKRVLVQAGMPKAALLPQASLLDRYLPFILETLKKYPLLTASRLYEMVRERGYEGGPDHFRHPIALHRPRPVAEAYLRLCTLPGEQGQVDWGHFGHIQIGNARRPLMAFVMVLSYSRKPFLHFFLNAQISNFLQGHVLAFEAFGGVPRVLLYDNLKSAVLERKGDAIRFNPVLLEFSAHYRYEARPVAVARGNEKGRVERLIRTIRNNFFAAREWRDLEDLNAQAQRWCEGYASSRPCPEDKTKPVQQVFEEEKGLLIALPDNPFPTFERVEVNVGKTPYVRFDGNDYSVPHTHVRRTLTVQAEQNRLSILAGSELIATHPRCYDKGKQIEDESHIHALKERKTEAHQHRGQDRLTHAVPCAKRFLMKAAERQYTLSVIIRSLLSLLDHYGAAELETGMTYALAKDVPHPNTVRLCLQRRREEKDLPPPVNLNGSQHEYVRHLTIKTPSLEGYDALQESTGETL